MYSIAIIFSSFFYFVKSDEWTTLWSVASLFRRSGDRSMTCTVATAYLCGYRPLGHQSLPVWISVISGQAVEKKEAYPKSGLKSTAVDAAQTATQTLIHRYTQTLTDTHRHTPTHKQTHKHRHTNTHTNRHIHTHEQRDHSLFKSVYTALLTDIICALLQ